MTESPAMCDGKAKLTRALAVEIAARDKDVKRGPYRCKICGAWHLGRKPKKIALVK